MIFFSVGGDFVEVLLSPYSFLIFAILLLTNERKYGLIAKKFFVLMVYVGLMVVEGAMLVQ